jgi:threonine dehydrogenase-like Zn-dependent dehydrogenase
MKCDYCQKRHFPVFTVNQDRLPVGFTKYVPAPKSLIEHDTYRLAINITDDQSTLTEPLAYVVQALQLTGLQNNQIVLVMGCGTLGLCRG